MIFWPYVQGSHIDGSRVVGPESCGTEIYYYGVDHKKDHSRYVFQTQELIINLAIPI